MKKTLKLTLLTLILINVFSCQKAEEELASIADTNTNVLYVSTGACNSGPGQTAYTSATATRTIERFAVSNGASLGALFDYGNAQSGMQQLMSPAAIYNSGSSVFVLNEGGAGQRNLIRVPKSTPYTYTIPIANNALAFTNALTAFTIDDEGSFLISKNSAIEKFNSISTRLTASGAAWVTSPGGSCASAAASVASVLTLPTSSGITGHVIYSNQGVTSSTNRLGIIYGGTGYINTSNCLSGAQINTTAHTKASNLSSGTIAFIPTGTGPTSMVLVPFTSGTVKAKLIVSYSNAQTYNSVSGSVTTLNHGIAAWDIVQTSPSTASLVNPVVLVENHNKVFAVSAMAYDSSDNSLYVAVGGVLGSNNQTTGNAGYNIEKYTLDLTQSTGPTLTRVGTQPFILGGSNTKCISGLAVGQ